MARLILVADDSPTVQRRAQGILQAAGFDVETVSNGVAAIKKLPKMEPLLVLADVSMPGKDGYEVCDYVKNTAELHHVPVLLVASDLEPYDERRGAQVGADGIIKKPFSPEDLMAEVAKFTGVGVAPVSPAAQPETPVASSPSEPGLEEAPQPFLTAPASGTGLEEAAQPTVTAPEPFPQPMIEATLEALLVRPEAPPRAVEELTPEPIAGAPEAPAEAVPVSPEPVVELAEEYAWVAPEPEAVAEAAPEGVSVSPEAIAEAAEAATPESIPVIPELSTEPMAEAPAEAVPVSPEPVREVAEEYAWLAPEPEAVAEAAPEGVLVSPEAMPEAAEAPAPEAVPVAPEAPSEPVAEAVPEAPPAFPAEEPLLPTAPALAAQQVEPVPPLRPSAEVFEGGGEGAVAIGGAVEGAGPMLIDELATAPPAHEPPPSVEGQQPKRVAATSLDGFSLTQAAEGQVYIAPPGAGATPSPEAGVVQPGEGPEPSPSLVSQEWVYVIVYKVVMKMAPPMLSPDHIAALIRELTKEITAELNAESSQPY